MSRKILGPRRQRELATVELMIRRYQQANEPENEEKYQQLYEYAKNRLERCYFRDEKPACQKCPIHCYQPIRRAEIRAVMRWAGPRMFIYSPMKSLYHFIDSLRAPPDYPIKK